jgi:hypothetical protein
MPAYICFVIILLPVSAVGYGMITGLFMPAFPDDTAENQE